MPGWLSVVLLVALVLGALVARERLRMGALEKWAKAHGFRVRSPYVPEGSSPASGLAARFTARGARRWGAAVEGAIDGVPVTLAEFETTWAGARETRKWKTLAFWPSPGTEGTVVVWREPAIDLGLSVAPEANARLDERLGTLEANPDVLAVRTPGGLRIEADPAIRREWLGDERTRSLESWTGGGEFARDGSHAAWRRDGVLSAAQLDEMVAAVPAARRMLA
jgi:hypothetical protein